MVQRALTSRVTLALALLCLIVGAVVMVRFVQDVSGQTERLDALPRATATRGVELPGRAGEVRRLWFREEGGPWPGRCAITAPDGQDVPVAVTGSGDSISSGSVTWSSHHQVELPQDGVYTLTCDQGAEAVLMTPEEQPQVARQVVAVFAGVLLLIAGIGGGIAHLVARNLAPTPDVA